MNQQISSPRAYTYAELDEIFYGYGVPVPQKFQNGWKLTVILLPGSAPQPHGQVRYDIVIAYPSLELVITDGTLLIK